MFVAAAQSLVEPLSPLPAPERSSGLSDREQRIVRAIGAALVPEGSVFEPGGEATLQRFERWLHGANSFQMQIVKSLLWAAEIAAVPSTGRVDETRVSVIWESPTFPDYQFTIRGDVDKQFGPGFKDKVRQAIVSLADPEILGYFARSKFIPASNAEYAPIEEVATATKLD